MAKIIQALLGGLLFGFILDYFLFLGLKLNYIDPLGVEVFFNVFFVDNQNYPVYFLVSIFLGYLLLYTPTTVKLPLSLLLFGAVFATLVPNVGKNLGEKIFMQKNVTLHNKKFTFKGDIYYIGRDTITFYDKELKKVIQLKKEELTDEVH